MSLIETWLKTLRLENALFKEKTKHHFVFIEVPKSIVGPEIMFWGEASWWPPQCPLRFNRKSTGPLQTGTRYEQKFAAVFPLRSELEVTKLVAGREIERTFVKGALRGIENITIEGRYNGTKVHYRLRYQLNGIPNKILWALFLKRTHSKSIDMILQALKRHIEKSQGIGEEKP
jgi:hypothetical protein